MIEFLASIAGRNLRIALGLVLIVVGLLVGKPLSGYAIRHPHSAH